MKTPLQLPIVDVPRRSLAHRTARLTALVAALFCVIVATRLIFNVARTWNQSPLLAASREIESGDRQIADLRSAQAELAKNPENESAKERIRAIDLTLRQRYFTLRSANVRGGYLLLAGMIVMLLSLKMAGQWNGKPVGVMDVFPAPADAGRAAFASRLAVSVVGCVVVATLAVLAFSGSKTGGASATERPTVAALENSKDVFANWPSFRGPQGAATTAFATAPTQWDGPTQKGIAWKTPIPLPGNNSPIVWGDKIFLSGATESKQEVFCYSLTNGEILWHREVKGTVTGKEIEPSEEAGYAPNTLATDGERVYALFPTGDLAAFDFAGKGLWSKSLGKPESPYGLAASLAVWRDRVIVQMDQGGDERNPKSAILAFDGLTGKEVWKTRRNVPASWSSPTVICPGGDVSKAQVVTTGNPFVIAYDPATGAELWKASVLDGEIAPSAAFADGRVFVANDAAKAAAIRIDGKGDVTQTHVDWTAEEGLPDIVSPLASKDFVLVVNAGNMATCYAAGSGKKLWEHDIGAGCRASPVLVGELVYLLDVQGVMHIFRAMPEFKEIGTPTVDEQTHATPAFVAGRIIIRGKKNLFCVVEGGR